MGRGRSKARQTKVARDLKYSSHEMDLEQLAEELHSEISKSNPSIHPENISEGTLKERE